MVFDKIRRQWPVIVIGAGPAGLVAAIALARAGVSVLVLNRRTGVWDAPRATVVSLRSMELFRSWGIEGNIRETGDDVEWLMRVSPTLATVADGVSIEVGYPTTEGSARLSPTRPAAIPQDQLETILAAHLRRLPGARLVEGTEAVDVGLTPDAVHVKIRDVESGREETLRGRYVVAADGAHSRTRTLLGIPTRRWHTPTCALSTLFHAPLWEVVGPHRHGIYVVEDPVRATLLPAGHGDRWVHSLAWEDGETEPAVDEATILDRIRASAGIEDLPVRLVRTDTFFFSAAMADTFRVGNVFLIGDAAHRVTPRGGTGMNSAIGDGRDLAWKLSWVLRGWAGPSLLDTYEAERRPVAEHNLRRSLDPIGSRRPAADEVRLDLGNRIAHRWVSTSQGRRSNLDLLGPGLTLTGDGVLVRPDGVPWGSETVPHLVPVVSAAARPRASRSPTPRSASARTGAA